MLRGKTAVVTGGSRGIGRAICLEFAKQGANVALLYVTSTEKAEEVVNTVKSYGVQTKAYMCHVAQSERVRDVFADIINTFGHIDILVNNAGFTRDKLLLSMKEQEFDEVLSVHLKGAYNTIRQVYPLFMRQKSGKIINITSVAGLIGNSGQANYASAKAGLIGLTKTVARELASRGVSCNAIAPGFIETDMTERFQSNENILASIPLRRMGKAEEVAHLAAFLASSHADYITGEVIRIDGGLAM